MIWFEVDKATNEIKGWVRSGKAKTLPPDTPTSSFVESDEAGIAAYESAQSAMRDDRRGDRAKLVNGSVQIPEDGRRTITVTADKTTITADGVDGVTLTLTALNDQGNTAKAFNGNHIVEIFDGRLLSLDFVNGVAVKQIKMPKSGRFELGSNDKFKIVNKIQLTALE